MRRHSRLAGALLLLMACATWAQGGPAHDDPPQPAHAHVSGSANENQVVVTGVVPDHDTKATVLDRLRDLYGQDRVIDEITVADVVAPPHWATYLERLLVPQLTQVSRGQLTINGNDIHIEGNMPSPDKRQTLIREMSHQLNPSYGIDNNLQISASEQKTLDQTLANRTITFETSSAVLTATGQAIVHEMAAPLKQLAGKTVEIIGHTDNSGSRSVNIALSKKRAEAVKKALLEQGVDADTLVTLGAGADRPIASNETEEGRARNRRIEFRIINKTPAD